MSGSGGEIHVETVGVGMFVSTIVFLAVVYIVVKLIYRATIDAIDRREARKGHNHVDAATTRGGSYYRSSAAQASATHQQIKRFHDVRPRSSPVATDGYKMVNYDYVRREKLMTSHERGFYRKLFGAVGRQYLIFPQLNLDKLLNHRIKRQYHDAAFRSIRTFSVDYVLCDTDFRILCAIELDDSTHDQPSRRRRDRAVNQVLDDAGLPLIRVPLDSDMSEDGLRSLVSNSVLGR